MESLKGSYQMMCRAMNGGWAAMAQALGASVTSLQNSAYCRKGQQMTVKRAMAMQAASRTTYFVEAVARECGGVFIALPPATEFDNADIQEKYVELLELVGSLARTYREATKDNEVDRYERRDLKALEYQICQLVTQINQMTFLIYCKQES
ncbi:YmfL family putative regulatory protein [Chromobacterium violaceum]|uniref:YmfL family putative regulatory protein n=1 Tax=Chromobacterium violaceum TaxID=536 RepID=UPI00068FA3E5|nr:YmfL family putative regulatory protein [Chromobacterium violaceum]